MARCRIVRPCAKTYTQMIQNNDGHHASYSEMPSLLANFAITMTSARCRWDVSYSHFLSSAKIAGLSMQHGSIYDSAP
jgi:hypothetical protein